MIGENGISDYLVQRGAQLVTHAALLESGHTIAVLPDAKQKKAYISQSAMVTLRGNERKENYQTRNILFTLIEIPPTKKFVLQGDSTGILFLENIVNAHDITRGERGFVKRDAEEPTASIREHMVKDGRIYLIPRKTRIYKLLVTPGI